ncbi:type IV pilus assembly protein PilY1 [Luteibacter rhizovicinus]|uniref:Type IV pilus assembly protein PilY1 n=1 Tax=Luteibacter rhizovicinus TaxID=242606 RepID=A0A4R3YWI0_9GAMM|nr:PilC/PilY family type IV pilus protein [Luteibacter rhizovicinus]TCV97031.1 type IV pilus assembly protein PilY1 [Luteibacter rhizovicinus]
MTSLSSKFHLLRNVALGLGLCVFGGYSGVSVSQTTTTYYTTDLSTTPPDLTVGVAPNIAVTFDDSGSMGSTNLPDTLDGTQSKKYYYSSKTNSQYYNPAITYSAPLTADGVTPFALAVYGDKKGGGAWRDGICANTTKFAVTSNGTIDTNTPCTATVNLSNNFRSGFGNNTTSGRQAYQSGVSDIDRTLAGGQDGGFYYTCPTVLSEAGCVITTLSSGTDADRQNFANWYSYYRTRNLMTRSAISDVFAGLGSTIRVVFQNLNNSNYVLTGGTTTFDAFADTSTGVGPRTTFFKWLYAVNASGGTPTRIAIKKAGDIFMTGNNNTIRKTNKNPYFEPNIGTDGTGLELSCRLNYSLLVTDGYWNGGDPGIPANTVQASTITLPDGNVYQGGSSGNAEAKIFWNVPATTTYSTLSDIAFNYWVTNLRPDFKNADGTPKLGVPPSFTDYSDASGNAVAWNGTGTVPAAIYFNPKNDPATWPHLVQFMITLGIDGTLAYDGDYAALRKGTKSWPTPTGTGNGDATDIDDTWHAAVNSRGQYFSARDPAALTKALSQLLARIIARTSSSVAGVLNTAVLSTSSVTYTTGYDSASWVGSLLAKSVDSTGAIGSTLWDGSALLTTRNKAGDSRVILTSTASGSGNGAAFQWASVQAALTAVDSTFNTGSTGSDRLKYLRGDTTKEGTSFRTRVSALGAIINSQPVYVAYPASGYRDSFPNVGKNTAPEMAVDTSGALKYSYEQFVADHQKRAPTLYVGANDGMLHAFDATTSSTKAADVDVTPDPGKERWAYVPFTVYGSLNSLTPKSGFNFVPTVDATPVARDVFFSGTGKVGWHTILIGGLRLGGRGIYALDITNASASESSPNSTVLWEFNSDSVDSTGTNVGANLGYTFGKPNVGRLANGKWVVLVPSGYFPTGSKVAAASNTTSSLFVLDAETGAVIKELKTPTSIGGISNIVSYGLSSAVLGDYNNDQVDDVAFAGDLQGNLWRFDLADPSPDKWAVTLAFRPKTPGDRPITVMPRLFSDPTSSYFMVVFGTGKYLGATDNTVSDANSKVQGIYGIRDRGPSNTAPVVEGTSTLVEQKMAEVSNVRGLTTNAVPATLSDGTVVYGWFINLTVGTPQTNKGERVVVDATALFDSGRAIITTLIPGSTDPCDPVRLGAVLVIDAATGGASSGVSAGSVSMTTGYTVAGARVKNVPAGGGLPAATVIGGGKIVLPGISLLSDGTPLGIGDAIWRRRSWRALNNGN